MTETLFAVVSADGVVENVIVADEEFVISLSMQIADPGVDTGGFSHDQTFVNVTDLDPRPGVGWVKDGSEFIAPIPTLEDQVAQEAARAEAEQRSADDEFLAGIQAKVTTGKGLSQGERDRMDLIRLIRNT